MDQQFIVIMAGGRGERFWPQSRLKRPKHLHPIVGKAPLLCQTLERVADLVSLENIFIITNREQRAAVREICPQLLPDQVVGEPVGRDTAAAVGLATVLVKRRNPQATFAILPSDHVVRNTAGFQSVLNTALKVAQAEEALITIGIKPTRPATGYGYIYKGAAIGEVDGRPVYPVKQFVEKPDRETAQKYLASGQYYWNAGMFIWRASVIAAALERYVPALWKALRDVEKGLEEGVALNSLLEKYYPNLEKISIDYAVMEKAEHLLTIESAFDWDDVGEWPALARHYQGDTNNNVIKGNAIIRDGSGNVVVNEKTHLTALIGVKDLIVVQTSDATLICPKNRAQEVKKLVQEISANPDWKHLA